jgi:F-box protein 9
MHLDANRTVLYSESMVADAEQETDELKSFRENWKREVDEKKRLQQSRQDPAEPAAALPEQSSTPEASSPHHSNVFRSRNDALEVYSRAVKHEQAGELDDALRLYRQAFRTDSNVDKSYHLKEQRARPLEAISLTATNVEENAENMAAVSIMDARSNPVVPGVVHMNPPSSPHHTERQVSGSLASILANFPMPLSFEPEDERALSPLQRLPDELLVHIIRYLGAAAIEHFALVSRKARMITLDVTIWRSDLLLSFFSNTQRRSLCGLFRTLSWLNKEVLIVNLFTGHS